MLSVTIQPSILRVVILIVAMLCVVYSECHKKPSILSVVILSVIMLSIAKAECRHKVQYAKYRF